MATRLAPARLAPARTTRGAGATRRVTCHHCQRPLDLPAAALTATCPACYKPLILHDLDLSATRVGGDLRTCARLIVRPKVLVQVRSAIAAEGLIVLGTLETDAIAHGPVHIGAKGVLRGNLTAPAIYVEPGGQVHDCVLSIARAG